MENKSKVIAYGILRALGILGGIVFVIWFLYQIQAVLIFRKKQQYERKSGRSNSCLPTHQQPQ